MKTKNNDAQNSRIDLQYPAQNILKTLTLLERSYGLDYLVRILQGDSKFGLRKVTHGQLETFGSMPDIFATKLTKMIELLITQAMIKVQDPRFGNLEITESGKQFIENPGPIWIDSSSLNENNFDRLLGWELRRIRREISEAESTPSYEIFTNHLLRSIVAGKPSTIEDIRQIPGFGHEQVALYGAQILGGIQRVEEKPAEVSREYRITRAQSASHQAVKALFKADQSLEQISLQVKLSVSTVEQYLENLHLAGQINFLQWIEAKLDSKDLHRGAEFFKQTRNSRLTEAKEVLGMEFDVLRMCRFYAAA